MGQNKLDHPSIRALQEAYKEPEEAPGWWENRTRRSEDQLLDPLSIVDLGPDLPRVPHPGLFRPHTEVRGDSDFAQTVDSLFRAVPDLQGRVKTIQRGPTQAAVEALAASGFGPELFGGSNLLGIYDPTRSEIGITPSGDYEDSMGHFGTVGHELGHAIDIGHGPAMDDLETALQNAYPNIPPKPLPPLPQQRSNDPTGLLNSLSSAFGRRPPTGGR